MTIATPARPASGGIVARAVSALRYPRYRLYFISGMGMTASQGVEQLALSWLVLDITGSLKQLGLVIFARGVPMLLVGLFGGVLADRYNRRNLLVATQCVMFLNLFALAMLVITGRVVIWEVYVSSFILGITFSLTMPARQALVRGLVDEPDLMNAVALNSMQQNAARIIWPTVAGGIIALAGVGATVMFCAFCYVFGIVFLVFIRGLDSSGNNRVTVSPLRAIGEGLRYSFASRHIRGIMILSFSVGSFGLAFMQLGPGFARTELHLDAGLTGLYIMASGIGSVIATTALLAVDISNRGRVFVVMAAGFGLSLFLIAVDPIVPLSFLLMGFFGICSGTLPVLAQTIFQVSVPDRLLGRVVSVWSMSGGLGSLSALPLGVVGQALGLRWALGGASVMLFSLSLVVGLLVILPAGVMPAETEDHLLPAAAITAKRTA